PGDREGTRDPQPHGPGLLQRLDLPPAGHLPQNRGIPREQRVRQAGHRRVTGEQPPRARRARLSARLNGRWEVSASSRLSWLHVHETCTGRKELADGIRSWVKRSPRPTTPLPLRAIYWNLSRAGDGNRTRMTSLEDQFWLAV